MFLSVFEIHPVSYTHLDVYKRQEIRYESGSAQAEMMNGVMDLIRSIRNVRAEMNVPPSVKVKLTVLTKHEAAIEACAEYLKKLAYASDVEVVEDKAQIPENSVSAVCAVGEAFMPLAELIDVAKEIERLKKEEEKNNKEIGRAEGKLNNKGFTDKAPAKVVEEERAKLETYLEMRTKLKERISFLEGLKGLSLIHI